MTWKQSFPPFIREADLERMERMERRRIAEQREYEDRILAEADRIRARRAA